MSPRDPLDPSQRSDPETQRALPRLKRSLDILVAAALVLVAAVAAALLPSGSTVRMAIVLPIVLTAPGYLLLQALLVPRRPAGERARHVLLSIGISPAVLGLLALSTAIVPGGFQPEAIVTVVTLGCLSLAGISFGRRWSRHPVLASEEDEDVTQTA